MTKKYLLTTFCFLSCFLQADDLNQAFEKATTYFKAGEMSRAITYFDQAYQKAPAGIKKDIIAYNLATSYLKNGQSEKAIDLFKDVYESKDNLPEYLFERCTFNFIMAQLGRVNQALSSEDASLESLNSAQEFLSCAEQIYRMAYQPEDGFVRHLDHADLGFSIKGLKSDLHYRIEQAMLEKLSIESAIEKLKNQIGDQVSYYERLGQKKLDTSLRRYFLSQQYTQEKKAKSIWQKLEELVEDQISQHTLNSSSETQFEEQKNLKKQIVHGYNDYLASLDCMRENQLWVGRVKSAKSKLTLDLLDLYLKQQDPIEYCLQKRIDISEKQQEKSLDSSFVSSLHKELKHTSSTASALIEQMIPVLETSDNSGEKKHIISLAENLKKQVKNLYSVSSVYKDYYVYQQMVKDPMDVLYPVYVNMKSEQHLQHSLYQLQAAYEFFDIQKDLSCSEDKMRKIKRSCKSLDGATKSFEEKEYKKSASFLEDFLSHWNFKGFIIKELQGLSSEFQPLLQSQYLDSIRLEKISADIAATNEMRVQVDLSTEDFALCSQLEPGFKGAMQSMQMQKKALEPSYQKILVTNAHQWIKRLVNSLEKKELVSTQILSLAIEEQELALGFSNEYPNLGQEGLSFDNDFLKMAIRAEEFPIEAANSFESKYYQEKAQEGSGQKIKKDKVISAFHKGLECAHKAQKKLKSNAIDWNEVKDLQEKTIEHWQEALSLYNQSEDQQSDQSSTSSNQSQGGEEERNNPSSIAQFSDNLEENQTDSKAKAQPTIMGILEKLNEMQQDDKIVENNPQQAKEGLRPW
ncbi:MAG: hypothetical protein S4CHLAM6_16130 [Chlamydiae bacterium]|nr:hypothetical protein [Chlamydiota bacterium]